jgi:hypothetical protein
MVSNILFAGTVVLACGTALFEVGVVVFCMVSGTMKDAPLLSALMGVLPFLPCSVWVMLAWTPIVRRYLGAAIPMFILGSYFDAVVASTFYQKLIVEVDPFWPYFALFLPFCHAYFLMMIFAVIGFVHLMIALDKMERGE